MTALPDLIGRESAISFPMLGGIVFDPPSSITLFGRTVYLYGLVIAVAFAVGMLWCARHAPKLGVESEHVYDVFLWTLPAAIIGARLYYVLFRLDWYRAHPGEILAVWEGGLAIYGGILGGILAVWLTCRRRKVSALATLDLIAPAVLLGQAIGRWGNFFNREAFGRETEIFCRMGLTTATGETVYVHPTFLYESLWNTAGFVLMSTMLRKGRHRYNGQFLALYFLWYGLGRAFIEGLRTDSLMIPGTAVRVSQVLSILLAAGGAAVLVLRRGTSSAVSGSSSPSP